MHIPITYIYIYVYSNFTCPFVKVSYNVTELFIAYTYVHIHIYCKQYSLLRTFDFRYNKASDVCVTEDVRGNWFARQHDLNYRRRSFYQLEWTTKPRSRSKQAFKVQQRCLSRNRKLGEIRSFRELYSGFPNCGS